MPVNPFTNPLAPIASGVPNPFLTSKNPFSSNQLTFATHLIQGTGLSGAVVMGWIAAEEPVGANAGFGGTQNWLNIGITGSGARGSGNSIWSDPAKAGDASASWLKGALSVPGFGSASSGIQGILRTVGQPDSVQISAIQRSGWATSGYPTLPALVAQYGKFAPAGSYIVPGGPANAGGTGTLPNDALTSGFRVGDPTNPDEDYWTAMNRIAQERYWYLFSDGETLYLADGPDLMKQDVALSVDRIANIGNINNLELTFDNCLAVDTPIPTLLGWKRMSEVSVGDKVLGSDGKPTRVVGVSTTHHDHCCYRLTFDDGTSIVADEGHLWQTVTSKRDAKTTVNIAHQAYEGIRTTEEVRKTLCVTTRRRPQLNHRIKLAKALDLPERSLPIEPYILGYWLGDGTVGVPKLTVGDADFDHLMVEVGRAGYSYRVATGQPRSGSWATKPCHDIFLSLQPTYRRSLQNEDNLTRRLRELGLERKKFIPGIYLRASRAQRQALLQGIMDSDGTMSNRCEITLHDRGLANGVLELIRTLGYKPYISSFQPRPPARKRAYRIAFAVRGDCNCFRLHRKAQRYQERLDSKSHSGRPDRMIVSIEPVESVPVRCIQVDSPDHLYLAGTGMVPTHNTAWTYTATHRKRKRVQRRSALAKVTSPVEAQLHYVCAIDAARAGDVVELANTGPGDGKWLVGDCRRSVFEVTSEISLVVALTPLTETALNPAGVNPLNNTAQYGPGVGVGNVKGYVNPVGNWSPTRIDAGVDGTLSGNYLAPGDSRILVADASNAGWQGGGYIAGQFTSGPLSGKVWYVAEGVVPTVSIHAVVKAGTPVARPANNPYNQITGNIETGWAVPTIPSLPLGFHGNKDDQGPIALAAGNSFNRFLVKLGAKPGTVQKRGIGVTPAAMPGGYP